MFPQELLSGFKATKYSHCEVFFIEINCVKTVCALLGIKFICEFYIESGFCSLALLWFYFLEITINI